MQTVLPASGIKNLVIHMQTTGLAAHIRPGQAALPSRLAAPTASASFGRVQKPKPPCVIHMQMAGLRAHAAFKSCGAAEHGIPLSCTQPGGAAGTGCLPA
jgi:hypothetical protein